MVNASNAVNSLAGWGWGVLSIFLDVGFGRCFQWVGSLYKGKFGQVQCNLQIVLSFFFAKMGIMEFVHNQCTHGIVTVLGLVLARYVGYPIQEEYLVRWASVMMGTNEGCLLLYQFSCGKMRVASALGSVCATILAQCRVVPQLFASLMVGLGRTQFSRWNMYFHDR